MKRFLKNKKGVSLLEGLIALMLLALVATGTFGVLLSTSRKTSQPDIREEMAFAVERAMNKLQVYVGAAHTEVTLPTDVQNGLCGEETTSLAALDAGEHDIKCMLPPICDVNHSTFTYTIEEASVAAAGLTGENKIASGDLREDIAETKPHTINFNIECNGFKL